MFCILKAGDKKLVGAISAVAILLILIAATPMAAYAEYNTLRFSVKQVFTTSWTAAGDTFTYRLKPLDPGAPLPAGSPAQGYVFTIRGNNRVTIDLVSDGRQGVYRYELYQVTETAKPGYVYDKRLYIIEVHLDAGKITVRNERGVKVEDILFENGYSVLPSDPQLMTDPPVIKNVFGNPPYNSVFTFKLAAQEASQPMPAGSVGGVKTITVTGAGYGEFGVWSYHKAGVYYYTVYEVNSAERGYAYDTAVYTITDTVREENGRLVLARTVTNDRNKPVSTLTFINTYRAGGGLPGLITGNGDGTTGGSVPAVPVSSITGGAIPGGGVPVSGKTAGDSPKTGDDSNTMLYLIVLAAGGLLVSGSIKHLMRSASASA